jgi:hypothetical protein
MKTLALYLLSSVFYLLPQAHAADSRVITENGTNILAVGIDSRDFTVVRFYLTGTNIMELRPDSLRVGGSPVRREVAPKLEAERDAILAAIKANTNVSPGNVSFVISNMVRLQIIEANDAKERSIR